MRYAYDFDLGNIVMFFLGPLDFLNVSSGPSACFGSYLGHYRSGDFLIRVQHVRNPSVGSAHVCRGGGPVVSDDMWRLRIHYGGEMLSVEHI